MSATPSSDPTAPIYADSFEDMRRACHDWLMSHDAAYRAEWERYGTYRTRTRKKPTATIQPSAPRPRR